MFKTILKPALAAGIAIATLSAPAAAQVNGMAVVRPAVVMARSQALVSGWQAISTQYATQIQQIDQLNTQREGLLRSIDTNGNGQLDELDANSDGQVDQAEQGRNPAVAQVTTIDQQIGQLEAPIQMAQLFVINQVLQQYGASAQQVVAERNVQIMLAPDAVVFGADGLDISELVANALNARLPSVSVTPTAGWQPDETTIGMYQQVQQLFAIARAQQAQAGAAAQPAAGSPPPR